MGLEQVVDEILARGRVEAEEIRSRGRAERERMLQDGRADGARLHNQREQEAREAAERRRVQDLARAELESKKTVLAAQKGVLDAVYAMVLKRLEVLADRASITRALLAANESDWREGKVYANARDETAAKEAVGSHFAGTIDCVGGVVIESSDGTRKTDLRFETLLADVWRDSIREVAEVLWPTG
ncbi:MAG TPA: V-type ATP synthase subunit E family protein [Thermoplasmata archaeon]|nr:V-type ATP synthase subunit E family protein [Thermoplasmata archaeon]